VDSGSGTVGTGGGAVDTGSGDPVEASVDIPAGALSGDEEISVTAFDSGDLPPPPPGQDLLSRAFNFGPDGLTFSEPVFLTFSYTDAEIAGLDEDNLTVLILDGTTWLSVPDCADPDIPDPDPCVASRDTGANTLTVVTTHFSTYGIGVLESEFECHGEPATIVSDKRVILGTHGDDVIVALGGNNVIFGLHGDDVICAGPGNDIVFGGRGDDKLFGEDGNDVLIGDAGNDYLDGGPDWDICLGGSGFDTVKNCELPWR